MAKLRINKITLPDKDQWKDNFLKSEMFDKIKKKSVELKLNEPIRFIDWNLTERNNNTPREWHLYKGQITLISYYMIDYLVKNTDGFPIIDVGCGMNLFKEIYPIIGLDDDPRADIRGFFDAEFARDNAGKFAGGISINALHLPIPELKIRILQFSQIIQKNKLCYLALNSQRLLEFTNTEIVQNQKLFDTEYLAQYIFDQINEVGNIVELLYYEDSIKDEPDDYMDGNIKMFFRKIK